MFQNTITKHSYSILKTNYSPLGLDLPKKFNSLSLACTRLSLSTGT